MTCFLFESLSICKLYIWVFFYCWQEWCTMLSKGRALCANNKSLTLFSAKLNFSSNYDEQSESSYESFKKVARKTGDAAKEWMVGSRETGSTPYKQSKRNTYVVIDCLFRQGNLPINQLSQVIRPSVQSTELRNNETSHGWWRKWERQQHQWTSSR